MRLATINIWSGLDYQGLLRCGAYETDSEREVRYRHLVERLKALDADVIAVNEANPVAGMMRRLAADLGYHQVHWRGVAGVRLGPIGLPANLDEGDGILARRELGLVPVARARLTGGLLGRWGSLNFSNATQVVCGRITFNKVPVYLFNTHWTVARTAADYAAQATYRDATANAKAKDAHGKASVTRLVESRRTLRAMQQILPPDARAILCGDLNASPNAPEIRAIENAGFIDAFQHVRPQSAGATWDARRNDIIRKFYRNGDQAPDEAVRVDYIFVNHPVAAALTDVRLGLHELSDRPHPSDHFALVCDLDPSFFG